jgi:hypothetical protein
MITFQKWIKILATVLTFLLVGALIVFWPRRQKKASPLPDLSTEIRAISAEAKARRLEVELGTEHARQAVEALYKERLDALTETQKKHAETLRADPAALAAWIVRMGAR